MDSLFQATRGPTFNQGGHARRLDQDGQSGLCGPDRGGTEEDTGKAEMQTTYTRDEGQAPR
eukprot:2161183-Pyramimonas_sp.AAC.1